MKQEIKLVWPKDQWESLRITVCVDPKMLIIQGFNHKSGQSTLQDKNGDFFWLE